MFIWGSSSSCSKLGLHYAPVGTQAKATAKVAAGRISSQKFVNIE